MPRLGVNTIRWILLGANVVALVGLVYLAFGLVSASGDQLRAALPDPAEYVIPPDIRVPGSRLTLALGRSGGSVWGVVLGGAAVPLRSVRDELLFLAGECAGLVALEAGAPVSPNDPCDA